MGWVRWSPTLATLCAMFAISLHAQQYSEGFNWYCFGSESPDASGKGPC